MCCIVTAKSLLFLGNGLGGSTEQDNSVSNDQQEELVMIQVTCACGATMQVQDENAGKQCKCPKCGAVCQIPAAPVAVTPVEATPSAATPPVAAAAAPAAAAVVGKRPGGLTALAVLNFVFGGFGILGGMWNLLFGAVASSAGGMQDEFAKFGREMAKQSGDPNAIDAMNKIAPAASSVSSMFYILGILGLVLAGFLIVAGVGYLKQSKKKGYMFGNIYGIAGIVVAILSMLILPWILGFGAIFGLIYPIVTLALLNTVFKNSFPNP